MKTSKFTETQIVAILKQKEGAQRMLIQAIEAEVAQWVEERSHLVDDDGRRQVVRNGCCYDNAAMERFFWSLKHEWTNHESYADLDEARLSVFKYIDLFYNSKRIHQALGYKTPDQYEAEHAPATKAA